MYKTRFVFGWLISGLQSLSSLALLATSSWLLSRAAQQPSVMYLSIAVVGVRAFALSKAFFRYSERLVLHDATFRKATKLRVAIYESLVKRAPIGLRDTKLGSLISSLVDDVDEIQNLDLKYRPALIQAVATTLATLILFIWLTPNLMIWMAIWLVTVFAATYSLSVVAAKKTTGGISVFRNEMAVEVQRFVEKNRVLKTYGWNQSSSDRIEASTVKLGELEIDAARFSGMLQSVLQLFLFGSVIVAAFIAHASGLLLPPEQIAVLVLIPLALFEYLMGLPAAIQARKKAEIAARRVEDLMQSEVPPQLQVSGSQEMARFSELQFIGACATYPGGREVELPDFELRAGGSVSIVGPSGAGKSTIANILVQFLAVSNGIVLLNGRPIGDYEQSSLRSEVGLLTQNAEVLSGSIRANLALAAPDATDEEFKKILELVHLWPMLDAREGLDTEVGSAGSNLSGGEAQRLSMARNLLAEKCLLILDEPTSSVEPAMAKELLSNLLNAAQERGVAIILITHDPEIAGLAQERVQVTAH
ncbi:MAG: transporter [Actinomycetota bacterium]